jgi:ankyrin repeat protein
MAFNMIGLVNIPVELWVRISRHLDLEKDISAFARLSRAFYGILKLCLYRHNLTYNESSALLWAAENGEEGTAVFLLDKGADVNTLYDDGMTPLHLAVEEKHDTIARLLIGTGKVNLTPVMS